MKGELDTFSFVFEANGLTIIMKGVTMQQHYFAGVLGLLTLIMMLNLESWLMRALYLGVMMLCLEFFGLTFGTIILIIFTLTVIFMPR